MHGLRRPMGLLSAVAGIAVAIAAFLARRPPRRAAPGTAPPPPATAEDGWARSGPPAAAPEDGRAPRSPVAGWVATGGPLAVSALSLGLSVFALVEANRVPEVLLGVPASARVAQGATDAWLYLQPQLLSTGANQRVEVVTDLRLQVEPAGDGAPAAFRWDETGTWDYDEQNGVFNWAYVGDPAPLVVSPTSPQLPTVLFVGPEGWAWEPRSYQVTVIADRAVAGEPLRQAFALRLSEEVVAELNARRGQGFVAVRTERLA